MRYFIQSLKFFLYKRILRKKFLNATDTFYNLNFDIEINDAIGRKIFKRGSLHPEHAQVLLSLPYTDGDIILDIGANIGWYSIVLRNNIKQKVKIFAFEPEPQNFQLLEKNISNNDVNNIVPVNKAVAEKTGHSLLFLYYPKNSGRHSLLDINPQTKKSIRVETTKLDDFLKNQGIDFQKIKMVKIDIEGYEPFALKGATELLQYLPYLFIEFSPGLMRNANYDPAKFVKELADFGFKFYSINGSTLQPRAIDYFITLDHIEDIFLSKESITQHAS